MDPARYDGSRPEPPYNTDTDAVALLQEELDTMTGDRDLFAKALAAMTADRDALRAELSAMRAEGMPSDRDALQALLDSAYNKGRDDVHALYQTGAPIALLRAELERTKVAMEMVRSAAALLLAEADDVMDRYESRCPIQAGELQRAIDQTRAALERKADA